MISLRDITGGCRDRAFVEELFESAFPADERPDISVILHNLKFDRRFRLQMIERDGSASGFITSWTIDDFRFIEHFAVAETVRGGGVGAAVLDLMKEYEPHRMILEVEPPEDELSRRRIGFYRRCGFALSEFPYMQPAYSPSKRPLPMRLMTWGRLDDEAISRAAASIARNVYGSAPKCQI